MAGSRSEPAFVGVVAGLCLVATLQACGGAVDVPIDEPARADLAPIQLTFAWPVGLRLQATSVKETTISVRDVDRSSPPTRVSYQMHATRHGQGLRVTYDGMSIEGLQPNQSVRSLMPELDVSREGTLVDFQLDERSMERPSSTTGRHGDASPLPSRPMMEPVIRYNWATLVGALADVSLTPGETTRIPVDGGGELGADVRLRHVADCPGRPVSTGSRCAVVELSQQWSAEDGDPFSASLLERLRATGANAQLVEAHIRSELTTETDSLVPHRERREIVLVTRLEHPSGPASQTTWRRVTTVDYGVIQDLSSGLPRGDTESETIRYRFSAYMTGVGARDPSVTSLVTRASTDYYAQAARAALVASKEELQALDFARRLTVLLLRCGLSPDQLENMTGPEIFSHAVAQGWSGGDGGARATSVEIDGDRAIVHVSVGDDVSPIGVFRREDGEWKLDIIAMLASTSGTLDEVAEAAGGEDALLVRAIEHMTGETPGEELWEPPRRP